MSLISDTRNSQSVVLPSSDDPLAAGLAGVRPEVSAGALAQAGWPIDNGVEVADDVGVADLPPPADRAALEEANLDRLTAGDVTADAMQSAVVMQQFFHTLKQIGVQGSAAETQMQVKAMELSAQEDRAAASARYQAQMTQAIGKFVQGGVGIVASGVSMGASFQSGRAAASETRNTAAARSGQLTEAQQGKVDSLNIQKAQLQAENAGGANDGRINRIDTKIAKIKEKAADDFNDEAAKNRIESDQMRMLSNNVEQLGRALASVADGTASTLAAQQNFSEDMRKVAAKQADANAALHGAAAEVSKTFGADQQVTSQQAADAFKAFMQEAQQANAQMIQHVA